MKKVITLLLFVTTLCCSCSKEIKEKDIPQAVRSAYNSLYPGAVKAKWERENDKYGVEFEQNGVETEVIFDVTGQVVETETEIPVESLPQMILDYASKFASGKKITEASRITGAAGFITYEIELGGKDYLFDSGGTLIRIEGEEVEQDKDNE